MRLIVLLMFFVSHAVFADDGNQITDKDIESLQSSIDSSIQKLETLKAKRRLRDENHNPEAISNKELAGLNNIPLAIQQALGQKDYTRYPPNPYQTLLKVTSPDKPLEMEFHAWLQADQDIFYNTEGIYMFDGTISYLVLNQNNVARYWLRRARPSIEGKAFEFLNYFINIDFGFNNPTLYDAFIDINYYRLLGLQVGRQMSLVGGIENYFDNFNYLSRAFTMEVSNSSMLAPDRQNGLVLHGSFGPSGSEPFYPGLTMLGFDDMFSYQVGWLTDTPDNQTKVGVFNYLNETSVAENNLKDYNFEGRVFVNPFINRNGAWYQHLGIGFSGSMGNPKKQGNQPILSSVGLNPIFTYGSTNLDDDSFGLNRIFVNGRRSRLHPQMVWGYGPLGFLADWTETTQNLSYFTSSGKVQDQLTQRNKANQITVVYNLTQEDFNLFHFAPNRPFKPFNKDEIGGLQMVFRLSGLQLDPNVFKKSYSVEDDENTSYTYYYYADPRISVQKANTWSIGLNWYWNRFIRWTTEYDFTSFVGGCSTLAGSNNCLVDASGDPFLDLFLSSNQVMNRPPEKIFMTRVQLQF